MLETPGLPSLPDLLDELINGLAAFDIPLLLVLDDYHVISNSQIHEALEYFINHQPASMHLVLTTRADLPLPLARLRARRQMNEIRARDLRFTADEARAFFGLANPTLVEDAIRALDERTEGWVAGLQLAALALQHQPDPAAFIETFHGSHRYVLDYLAGEVIQQQGEEMRTFLTQTSLLTRFNAGLCNALTGRDDSQTIIARLEQSNLFIIPLDMAVKKTMLSWRKKAWATSSSTTPPIRNSTHPANQTEWRNCVSNPTIFPMTRKKMNSSARRKSVWSI